MASLELRDLVDELDRRPGIDASLWFLRHSGAVPAANNERVIDDLRTDWRMARVDRFLGARIGARIRGLRLQMWLRSVAPDVVILDDGLGDRLFDRWPDRRTVLRLTSRLVVGDPTESVFSDTPDLVVADSLDDPRVDGTVTSLAFVDRRDRDAARAMCSPESRAAARRAAGLPTDGRLVVGWSSDPWNESGDLFLRTLWNAHAAGHRVHGLWLADSLELSAGHLADEVQRCGLDGWVHLRPDEHDGVEWSADVAVLPARHSVESARVRGVLCAGVPVVTFDGASLKVVSPDVHRVADLDLLAAGRLCGSVTVDREECATRAENSFGIRSWTTEFLNALERT